MKNKTVFVFLKEFLQNYSKFSYLSLLICGGRQSTKTFSDIDSQFPASFVLNIATIDLLLGALAESNIHRIN
jgi:hypothetical protein